MSAQTTLAGEDGEVPAVAVAAPTASATAATLERARVLIESVRDASDELASLYGALWHEFQAVSRSRPTTDPAGLDVALREVEDAAIDARPAWAAGARWAAKRIADATAARLSVADGPGPEERTGFCGSCGTPSHYAGDRTHPCLPVHREETTDG